MSNEKRSKPAGQKPPKGSYDAVGGGSTSGPTSPSSGRGPRRDADSSSRTLPAQADVAEIARAVSTGFTVLILGGLLQPVVTRFVPVLGLIWLILVAVVAFGYTGFRAGRAGPKPPLFGAASAVGAYLLVIPVLFLVGTFDPTYAIYTLAAGVVIGGAAGILSARLLQRG